MYEIIKTDFIKYKYLILINANNTLTKNYYTTYKSSNEFYNIAINNFGEDNVTMERI
tara:strand:- start:526 stop:696 length:171 start_codon:yes stop_codon:yes gene_type:complete